jgi:hypothetical protein
MRKALPCMALVLLLAACAPAATRPYVATPPSMSASSSPDRGGSEQAQIYGAVLRRYLTTPQDNSNLPFSTVFVLDHADVAAADPNGPAPSAATTPFSAADQAQITKGLRDVATVRFVPAREQVLIKDHGCTKVRDNGLLIVLGPPTKIDGGMGVGISGFAACLGATWFTYVVSHDSGAWTVTGTTGTRAIA